MKKSKSKMNTQGSKPKKMGYSKNMEVYGTKNVVSKPNVKKPKDGLSKR